MRLKALYLFFLKQIERVKEMTQHEDPISKETNNQIYGILIKE